MDCFICGEKNLSRNELGLNKKLINRDIAKFHCMVCLTEYLGITLEELEDRIEEFKDTGCELFE